MWSKKGVPIDQRKEFHMKTLEEIHKIREEKKKELDLRVNTKADTRQKHILVCHGTGCTSSKSPLILENFKRIKKKKI